jgi:hypothetical protein
LSLLNNLLQQNMTVNETVIERTDRIIDRSIKIE